MLGDVMLLKSLRRTPPGHALVGEIGATCLPRNLQFDGPDRRNETYQERCIIGKARRLRAESVHIHLRSDVPLGLFLSGGIDSAAILALMAREAQGRIKTFCVGYDARTPDNELLQARHTAQMFQTEHHERVIDA